MTYEQLGQLNKAQDILEPIIQTEDYFSEQEQAKKLYQKIAEALQSE